MSVGDCPGLFGEVCRRDLNMCIMFPFIVGSGSADNEYNTGLLFVEAHALSGCRMQDNLKGSVKAGRGESPSENMRRPLS